MEILQTRRRKLNIWFDQSRKICGAGKLQMLHYYAIWLPPIPSGGVNKNTGLFQEPKGLL